MNIFVDAALIMRSKVQKTLLLTFDLMKKGVIRRSKFDLLKKMTYDPSFDLMKKWLSILRNLTSYSFSLKKHYLGFWSLEKFVSHKFDQ